MDIRKAHPEDLFPLADLWQERRTILAQIDSYFAVTPHEREHWLDQARTHLTHTDSVILLAEKDGLLAGYIIGSLHSSGAGLIEEIALDAHRYHGGLGRRLVKSLTAWFEERGANPVVVPVPRRLAVEQAFWRSLGATEWTETAWKTNNHSLWMKLS